MAAVPQAEALEQFLRAGAGHLRVDIPERGDELEMLHRVKPRIEDGIIRDVGERLLGALRLGDGVDAADADLAGIGADEAGHHAQRGRLAGTIDAEKAVEHAARDREAELIYRSFGSEFFNQADDFAGVLHCVLRGDRISPRMSKLLRRAVAELFFARGQP